MFGAKQVSVSNHLLGALPRKDYQKLLPVLEPVKLAFGEILYESHAQIRHVYFPIVHIPAHGVRGFQRIVNADSMRT
jgi:hypothetical protein